MDGLVFADKLFRLLTAGDHNSTYQMATAMALMQVAQEADSPGQTSLSTMRIAEIVVDLYGIQLRASGGSETLRQMNRADQSSRILRAVEAITAGSSWPHRRSDTSQQPTLLAEVEDALLAYPLRLLQPPADQFLYSVPHPSKRSRAAFGTSFCGVLDLRPGVLALLQRSAPLLRPLIEGEWVRKVARYNAVTLDESELRKRLFGYERTSWPRELRAALEPMQSGCFYCGRPLPGATAVALSKPLRVRAETHIDHFLPWSRTMNDAIENLVLTDSRCNLKKSDYLCAPELVERWIARLLSFGPSLERTAITLCWPTELRRTVRSAVVQYDRYQDGEFVAAWNGQGVEPAELRRAADALRSLQLSLGA